MFIFLIKSNHSNHYPFEIVISPSSFVTLIVMDCPSFELCSSDIELSSFGNGSSWSSSGPTLSKNNMSND